MSDAYAANPQNIPPQPRALTMFDQAVERVRATSPNMTESQAAAACEFIASALGMSKDQFADKLLSSTTR
jgi:hypothetical protein